MDLGGLDQGMDLGHFGPISGDSEKRSGPGFSPGFSRVRD